MTTGEKRVDVWVACHSEHGCPDLEELPTNEIILATTPETALSSLREHLDNSGELDEPDATNEAFIKEARNDGWVVKKFRIIPASEPTAQEVIAELRQAIDRCSAIFEHSENRQGMNEMDDLSYKLTALEARVGK